MTMPEDLSELATGGAYRPATTTANPLLKSDSILIAEFTYASASAHEAVEDRARLFDRYLLIFGSVFVTGIGASYQLNQIGAKNFVEPLAVVALAFTGLLGVAFFLTLIRLRQAFVGAMIEMSKIKEYYLYSLRNEDPKLELAFGWKLDTVPETDRTFTVSYLMAHIVATLDSICLAAALFVGMETRQNRNSGNLLSLPHSPIPYAIASVAFALALTAQLVNYRLRCRGLSKEEKQALQAALRAG